jgi:thiol-disulfide isomerase/thioredoxin
MQTTLLIAPEFAQGEWLNSPAPILLHALRGRLVLVQFWHYASLRSLRALDAFVRMAQRYAETDVRFILVHVPRFAFERETPLITAALQARSLHLPTQLDNDYGTARAFGVRRLPLTALVDEMGIVRYTSDDVLDELDHDVHRRLVEAKRTVGLPAPLAQPLPFGIERANTPARITDIDTGSRGGALGNAEGYATQATMLYARARQRLPDRFYLEGAWRAGEQHVMYSGSTEGVIHLPYNGRAVYAVLAPHHEQIERLLHPRTISIEVWQDERPLSENQRGEDLTPDARVLVDRPRLYQLVRNAKDGAHELTLRLRDHGAAVYAFSVWHDESAE